MSSGKILIIDDDSAFLDLYRDILLTEGHVVVGASTAEQGAALLDAEIDVVLIDQKLNGPGGPDSGLELVAKARQLSPFAKPIIVTGYSSPEAIARAFNDGVYDYLVKNGAFEALLKAKVRNAVEITRERRLAALTNGAREQRIRALWTACATESDGNKKGAALEEVIELLFRSTPGFTKVESRLRTSSEEIDLTVLNEVPTAPWKSEGSYILCECKNWSSTVGAPEFRNFKGKFDTKQRRATVGVFVSMNGFTSGFTNELARTPTDVVMLLVDKAGVQKWIDSSDRLAFLSGLHQAQTIGR